MKVLVVGATGETGRRIVQQLVNKQIPVRAVVRDLAKAQSMLPAATLSATVELVVGDVLQPETLKAAIADCNVVLCATGARPSLSPLGPYQVDYEGTKNLIDVAKAASVEQFVLVTSLCASRFFHPLNLFWLILVWKHRAEQYLQQSGLDYTIVRPGGLKNTEDELPLVMSKADTLFEGSIPRTKVAQVCVEALFDEAARKQIVEIVAQPDAPARSFSDLFASVAA
jgi:uncharacterized protein YbjT (DUF2867 family)